MPRVKQSPPNSPFAWVALQGRELKSLHDQCQAGRLEPEGCFLSRDIAVPPVTVSVGKDSIWVGERQSSRLCRAVRFKAGFPSYSDSLSQYGNSRRVVIASDGSVVFCAGTYPSLSLYLWHFSSHQLRFLSDVEWEPEAIAVSPAAHRLAVVTQSDDWEAKVWSLPDGRPLALLQWHSIYCGTLASFDFSTDGTGLSISIDVSAQSGSDFTDDHAWDIGVGPEDVDTP